ncbi:hypothetical protein LCGC14_0365480 [marine sediment metagenome]|uniref:Uncharacterized protein n=1 Tax=marine sediment metagenome TaxID=412755 RepID=A0A0F9TPL6_9ZZZZ
MGVPTRRILDPVYGSPILRAANNGTAIWNKINTNSQWQNGTGWQACLTGGVQTGDDWGAAFFPVQAQVLVKDFSDALTTQWKYYMTATQTMGVNIVIWVHNPANLSQRAEITQIGGTALLGKTLGWNSHTLLKTTTQFVWYGEDWSGSLVATLTGSGLTAGTQYTWAQFQADVLFRDWEIYRVSLEHGWEASGTFQSVWLTEAEFNGQTVPIIPSLQELFAADTALAQVTLLSNTGVDIGDVDVLSIATGANVIGKVGIDQTTEGTTNGVYLRTGSNLAGIFSIDQVTANANEVVLKAGTADVGKVGHNKTGIGHGVETVDSAGADQPIVTASITAKSVIIQAQTDNTSAIAVGAPGVDATVATGNGILLYAGDWTPWLEIDDLFEVYIDALVTDEGVRFIYLT